MIDRVDRALRRGDLDWRGERLLLTSFSSRGVVGCDRERCDPFPGSTCGSDFGGGGVAIRNCCASPMSSAGSCGSERVSAALRCGETAGDLDRFALVCFRFGDRGDRDLEVREQRGEGDGDGDGELEEDEDDDEDAADSDSDDHDEYLVDRGDAEFEDEFDEDDEDDPSWRADVKSMGLGLGCGLA